jgi:glyoxylase-like metal-dependent hydrolase (beta-lactamase superfamily II)
MVLAIPRAVKVDGRGERIGGSVMAVLRQGWFDVREVADGIIVFEEPLHSEKSSLTRLGAERAALIDTGMGVADLKRRLRPSRRYPVVVLQSHAHFDHVGDAGASTTFASMRRRPRRSSGGAPRLDRAGWTPKELAGPLRTGFDPRDLPAEGARRARAPRGRRRDRSRGRTLTVCTARSLPGSLVFWDAVP